MLALRKIFYGVTSAVPLLGSILGLVAPTFTSALAILVDAAAIAVNAALGGTFVITCASDAVREISVPSNGTTGQRLVVRIINTSGGNLTNTTFAAAIRQPALTLPATTFQRDYELAFDGATWAIVSQSAADVPN